MESRASGSLAKKIASLDLTPDMEGVQTFIDKSKHFIETGEPWKGSIYVEEWGVFFNVLLSTEVHECGIRISKFLTETQKK